MFKWLFRIIFGLLVFLFTPLIAGLFLISGFGQIFVALAKVLLPVSAENLGKFSLWVLELQTTAPFSLVANKGVPQQMSLAAANASGQTVWPLAWDFLTNLYMWGTLIVVIFVMWAGWMMLTGKLTGKLGDFRDWLLSLLGITTAATVFMGIVTSLHMMALSRTGQLFNSVIAILPFVGMILLALFIVNALVKNNIGNILITILLAFVGFSFLLGLAGVNVFPNLSFEIPINDWANGASSIAGQYSADTKQLLTEIGLMLGFGYAAYKAKARETGGEHVEEHAH